MLTIIAHTDLCKLATSSERSSAYNTKYPDSVTKLLDEANKLRKANEHIGAGILERDAAEIIRMARDKAICKLVAARLLVTNDVILSLYTRQWLAGLAD